MFSFPFYKQLDAMDCGPSCLRMIAKYYGKTYTLQYLRELCYINKEGVSMLGISDASEKIGFRTLGVRLSFKKLVEEVPLPCIAHWNQSHFVVVYKTDKKHIWVADPGEGRLKYTHEEFKKSWIGTKNIVTDENVVINEGVVTEEGILLLYETTPEFLKEDGEYIDKTGFSFLFTYLFKYKRYIIQLMIGLLAGSLLTLVVPFLTQSIVDFGINTQNLHFVYIILIAQLMLFAGQTAIEFIRSWILLHISTRINISLISDFLIKLMKLPLSFFDSKMMGDLLQRINDHYRIENFLTSSTLSVLFSAVNLVLFSIVLLFYSGKIFLIFLVCSILYVLWILIFMKKRREIDYKRFASLSSNQSKIIQLVNGIQEIKLNNCEKQKRWEWEHIQAKLFNVNIKSLILGQYQQAGGSFINQLKNIFISFVAAKSVIEGDMTLGMMMSVQYIIGQLNTPITDFIHFIQSAQDAKISLERLGEIHQRDDEEDMHQEKIQQLPEKRDLNIRHLSFQYGSPQSEKVLNDVSFSIPQGKVTAIVGTSGSGKTTLLKMLLKFYKPNEGEILLGDTKLENISNRTWRTKCGVVMQDGYIFSDSIANNIAFGEEVIDKKRLLNAVTVANIKEFIESLPLAYNTKIGDEGSGVSAGQKQRILIARAVYKNPEYIFFDEATNALDANNERIIMENLDDFVKGKTVVVVAHRLSTVKNADQIIVLEKGKLIEKGTHEELTKLQGAYFHLVKNQLELGT